MVSTVRAGLGHASAVEGGIAPPTSTLQSRGDGFNSSGAPGVKSRPVRPGWVAGMAVALKTPF